MTTFLSTRATYLLYSVLAVGLLVVVFALPHSAHAERLLGASCTPAQTAAGGVSGSEPTGDGSRTPYCQMPDSAPAQSPTAESSAATGQKAGEAIDCSGGAAGAVCMGISAILSATLVPIAYIWFALMNFLLFITGVIFNSFLVETVFKFGQNFGNSEGLLSAWGILRDIGNIFLLFSFVFMGIATILNIQNYTMKKALPRLLIFAVLLNFSLFAAEAVVDVANGLSTAISKQSTPAEVCPPGRNFMECSVNYGLSGSIMDASGLSASLRTAAPEWNLLKFLDLNSNLKTLMTLFGLSIFSMITVVVFVAASIMLLFRVVVLNIILVTAPIGFAGLAVPLIGDKGGLAERWWHQLINQAFFVPIFLLLMFIGLKVLNGSNLIKAGQANTLTEALASGDTSVAGIFITFAVASGFMVAALMISKQLGAAGADFALKMGGNVGAGIPAMLGRHYVGGTSAMLGNWVRNQTGWKHEGIFGRRNIANLVEFPSRRSMDMRAFPAPIFGKADVGKPDDAASKGVKGIADKILQEKLAYDKLNNDRETAQQTTLESRVRDIGRDIRIMERTGEDVRRPDKYQKLQNDLAKAKNDFENLPKQRQAVIEKDLNAAKQDAERIADELGQAERTVRQMVENLQRAPAAEQRAAQEALALAREAYSRKEQEKNKQDDRVAELDDSLSLIRDSYARELEGAMKSWTNTYIQTAALTAARQKVLKYSREPHARDHDDLHKILHDIAHGFQSHGSQGGSSQGHAQQAAPAAKSDAGGAPAH